MSKLIVLSVDSLFDEDMSFLKTLPNFGKLLSRAAYSRSGMRSIYPSFTYPAHASIITGTYPERHGIYHNEKLDVGNPSPDWFWYHRDLKVETCIDAAKRAGLTTAVIGWPCMGGCPTADYLVPEIWCKKENEEPHAAADTWSRRGSEDPRQVFLEEASRNIMEDGIFDRHCHKLRRTKQPYMDHFMVGCACDILHRYRPDVMFIHLAHLDHTRHANGIHGPAVEQAIIANDEWLGRLMEATMDTGDYEDTHFAVISDHGHLSVRQMFNPNVLLVQAELITLDEYSRIQNWDAYCNSTALSCQVVLHNPTDRVVRKRLEKLLYAMRENREYGVESVLTKEECRQEHHLTGDFDYVLEGCCGTTFGTACTGPVLVQPDNSDYKFSIASHGHLPHKGPQPVFMIAGPHIKQGQVIDRHSILDEAPTFARLMGFDMPQAQGAPIEEILC